VESEVGGKGEKAGDQRGGIGSAYAGGGVWYLIGFRELGIRGNTGEEEQ